ncbi:MAG: DUF1194 domain-containing protein [Limimaricola sp.]|uniref:DUF1194 domain-containing protein n=1 Tax=Limimaricola sp. TaxID=2211665 RepID=UPI001D456867|nr:DUF1194 domain-containing protein [Limimaricola sp.]MBI1416390.1 DUF1194 domain-containing protein [Limimaricola sp.]
MRLAAALLALALAGPAHAAGCRQALAMGLDVSGSVDASEYRLQLDGLAAALTSPKVRALLLGGGAAPVRVAVYSWSGPSDQHLVLDWTPIDSATALEGVADTLRAYARQPDSEGTALGAAMQTGLSLLAGQSDCWRRTLDISGDGRSNLGPAPASIPAPPGITINGLVVGADHQAIGDTRQMDIKELSSYYRVNVLRGPDAFVETALGYVAFEDAMTRKLLREMAAIVVGGLP